MTLMEVAVALAILATVVGLFLGTIGATARQRWVNRENAVVAEAVCSLVERMRNEDFADVVRLYNADPFDDPRGPGTAPGNAMRIAGVIPTEDAEAGMSMWITFPITEEPDGIEGTWELREDFVDARLGTPRDLNGDSVIDDLDHASDYAILPMRVDAAWQGRFSQRTFQMQTMLVRYRD
ncbi:MAG: hypothetical protein GY711_20490 [bacterium]|nr:hypothetical protein [bacterium]